MAERDKTIKLHFELLQQTQLEACYKEASQEVDDAFDITAGDGLEEDELRD
jgi:hypothetical protein